MHVRKATIAVVLVLSAGGGLLAALAFSESSLVPYRDLVLVISGAMLGTISLIVDELVNRAPERRNAKRNEQLLRLQIVKIQGGVIGIQKDVAVLPRQRAERGALAFEAGFSIGILQNRIRSLAWFSFTPTAENIRDWFSTLGVALSDSEVSRLANLREETITNAEDTAFLRALHRRVLLVTVDRDVRACYMTGFTVGILLTRVLSYPDSDVSEWVSYSISSLEEEKANASAENEFVRTIVDGIVGVLESYPARVVPYEERAEVTRRVKEVLARFGLIMEFYPGPSKPPSESELSG